MLSRLIIFFFVICAGIVRFYMIGLVNLIKKFEHRRKSRTISENLLTSNKNTCESLHTSLLFGTLCCQVLSSYTLIIYCRELVLKRHQ